MGFALPIAAMALGKAHVQHISTAGGIHTLNTFEYMLHCHQKTYHQELPLLHGVLPAKFATNFQWV